MLASESSSSTWSIPAPDRCVPAVALEVLRDFRPVPGREIGDRAAEPEGGLCDPVRAKYPFAPSVPPSTIATFPSGTSGRMVLRPGMSTGRPMETMTGPVA